MKLSANRNAGFFNQDDAGQAIVEFALVLPLLLLIILGIIEFSVLFYNKAMVTNASREGARIAIELRETTDGICEAVPQSEIKTAVDNYLRDKLIDFGRANDIQTIRTLVGESPECDETQEGKVSVRVSYQHSFMLFPIFLSKGSTIAIGAETTMNRE